jgi:hypothetical protein
MGRGYIETAKPRNTKRELLAFSAKEPKRYGLKF